MLETRDVVGILVFFVVFGLGKPLFNDISEDPGPKERQSADRTAELRTGVVSFGPGSPGFEASEWYGIEGGGDVGSWRWARGRSPSVLLYLPPGAEAPSYRLDLRLEAATRHSAGVSVNGRILGRVSFQEAGMETASFLIDRGILEMPGRNELELYLEGDAVASTLDPRLLRLAYHGATLRPIPFLRRGEMSFRDDVYLWSGWSVAEEAFRWTDGSVARIAMPVRRVGSRAWNLEIAGTSGGARRMEIVVNGGPSESWDLDGWDLQTLHMKLAPGVLREGMNEVELRFPSPGRVPGDPRLLGFAFQWLRLENAGSG